MPDGRTEVDEWVQLEELALAVTCGQPRAWLSFTHTLAQRAVPIVRAQWRRLDPQGRFEEVNDVLHEVLLRVFQRLSTTVLRNSGVRDRSGGRFRRATQ